MEQQIFTGHVDYISPMDNFIITLENGDRAVIPCGEISRKPGKPWRFVGRTLKMYRMHGVQAEGMDAYSPREYEMDLFDRIREEFHSGVRNNYMATCLFLAPTGNHIIFQLDQGVLASLPRHEFGMITLGSMKYIDFRPGVQYPVSIKEISPDGLICLCTKAMLGSYTQTLEQLNLQPGGICQGLITGRLVNNPAIFTVMVAPNMMVLIDERDGLREGQWISMVVQSVDIPCRKTKCQVLDVIPAPENPRFDPAPYFIMPEEAWTDLEAFIKDNKIRKRAPADAQPGTARQAPDAQPCAAVEAPFCLQGLVSPFCLLENDTLQLVPPQVRVGQRQLQSALQRGDVTDQHVRIAELTDTLKYATLAQIAELVTLRIPDPEPVLARLQRTLNTLLHCGILASLKILDAMDEELLVYYRGEMYDAVAANQSHHRRLPYNNAPADRVKRRLAINALLIGVLRSHHPRAWEKSVSLAPTHMDPRYLSIAHRLSIPDAYGSLALEAVRKGQHERLLERLKQYDLRSSEDKMTVAVTTESEAELLALADQVQALNLRCTVCLTTDHGCYSDTLFPVVIKPRPFWERGRSSRNFWTACS